MKLAPYAKFIVAALVAALTALYAALSDDVVTTSEWVAIVLAGLGAVGVWAVPNKPAPVESHDPNARA